MTVTSNVMDTLRVSARQGVDAKGLRRRVNAGASGVKKEDIITISEYGRRRLAERIKQDAIRNLRGKE